MTLAYPLNDPRAAAPAAALTALIERAGVRTAYVRNEEIYAQDDPVERLHLLVSGYVRTTRLTSDGRRQVGEFYEPGDLIGLEPGPDHLFSAEALTNAVVISISRAAIRAAGEDAELDRAILEATRLELQRTHDHLLLLGRKSASERVAAFLLQVAQDNDGAAAELPMGRQDIADYLGLTIETVSRMLTQLQADAVVEFASTRAFRVTSWRALQDRAA